MGAPGSTKADEAINWKAAGLHGLLLLGVLICIFPAVFFKDEYIGPSDLLFLVEPWSHYAPPAFEGPVNPLMPDVVTAFYPYYHLTRAALSGGEWPLWNPLQFAGMPLLANAQSAVFYPPRLLHYLFEVPLATTLYILLKLWLCGMSAFICALGLRLPLASARFFSIAWMLCAYNLIWPNWSLPDVSIWLPILFLGVERLFEERLRSGTLLVALGGLFLLLAGHPETAFAMSLGMGVYFLVRLLLDRRWGPRLWRPVLGAAVGWTLALLVAAPQLLPFAEYLLHSSTFFDRPDQGYNYIYPPSSIVSFWTPRFFGASADDNYYGGLNSNLYMMLYPGIAVWALLGLLLGPRSLETAWRNRLLALFAMALWGVVVSFGFSWFNLVHRLPVFSSMIEAYHITATIFALPLLAAHALAWVTTSAPERWDGLRALAWLGIGAALSLYCYVWFKSLVGLLGELSYLQWQLGLAAVFAALSLLALLAWRSRLLRGPQAALLLTVILAIDLIYAGRSMNPTTAPEHHYPETELTQFLAAQPGPLRVSVGEAGIPTGIITAYGIEDWLAYDGLYPARMMRFQTTLGEDFWNAMEPVSAKTLYLHNPKFPPLFPLDEPGRFEKRAFLDGIEVYENKAAFPRAFLAPALEVVADEEALFARMADPGYEPGAVVLAEPHPSMEDIGPLLEGSGSTGSATIEEYTMNTVRLRVEAEGPAVLVLADAWYPGWEATLNGEAAPHFPVYHVFRGLIIPEAGVYEVVYRYRPASFRLGLGISTATLLISIVLSMGLLFRSR